jgi:hypothetical protein
MAKLSPVYNWAEFINGIPANGAKVFTYAAGSSTKQNTYTDSGGGTANPNPIILDSRGEPPNDIWLTEGQLYKLVFTASTDTDPPTSPIRTIDNISGVGDNSVTLDQWVDSGVTPTYVSATQFTVPGDQTSTFQVRRRIKATVTAGTVYGYITNAVFGALTTVTVVIDSPGALDSGLSAVQLGLITPTNTSLFLINNSNLDNGYINELTETSPALDDFLAGADTSASGGKIKILASALRNLFAPRGYIDGLTLSTAGSSTTMSIAAGEAKDSGNAVLMQLVAAISKTTSAWAVGTGNGGLDTGVIANATWYHFYLIRRPDTGVVDVVFSTNASSPTLPANYTQYRRIGSAKTNGSAQWIAFVQDGDYFRLRASVLDANVNNPGISAVLRTLPSVPTGINVFAIFNGGVRNTASGVDAPCYFSDPAANDEAPSFTVAPLTSSPNTANSAGAVIDSYAQHTIRTNTSAQIRTRLLASDASTTLNIATLGWIDSRGRNA